MSTTAKIKMNEGWSIIILFLIITMMIPYFVLAYLFVVILFKDVSRIHEFDKLFWLPQNQIPSRPTEETATDAHGSALRGTPRILLQRSFMPRMSWVSRGCHERRKQIRLSNPKG
jgi:hypothetical protein